MTYKVIILVLTCYFNSICAVNSRPKLPKFLRICHQSDPNLNDCIKESVENLRPLLAKGIPEFDIPSCEPLYIPEVVIDQGTGPVSVKSTYKDIKVFGPSRFVLKNIRIDLNKDRVRIKIWIPNLKLTSEYKMDGRILMLPISGSGTCFGNYSDIEASILMQGQRIQKDGEIYFNVKDFVVDFTIGHATIHLDNLFNGDSELAHWLRACRKNDPNFNNCLNDLFVDIFPELAKGIPELNVDPFEPLHLDRVSVSKGSGPITLSGSLFDLQVSGPSNATPIYTQLDLENKHWNFGVELPLLDIKSQYDLKGKILVLPLIGHGACEMKLGGVKTRVTTDINLPKIEGKEVLEINKMNVRFTVGKMKIRLHNLFNGNKVLGQTVNAFINQHALEIISELEENIADNLSVIFTDIINNVFTKIPTDLWILSDEEYEKYQKESS